MAHPAPRPGAPNGPAVEPLLARGLFLPSARALAREATRRASCRRSRVTIRCHSFAGAPFLAPQPGAPSPAVKFPSAGLFCWLSPSPLGQCGQFYLGTDFQIAVKCRVTIK